MQTELTHSESIQFFPFCMYVCVQFLFAEYYEFAPSSSNRHKLYYEQQIKQLIKAQI